MKKVCSCGNSQLAMNHNPKTGKLELYCKPCRSFISEQQINTYARNGRIVS